METLRTGERRRKSTKEMELCHIRLRRSVGHSIISRLFAEIGHLRVGQPLDGIGDIVNAEHSVLTIPIV